LPNTAKTACVCIPGFTANDKGLCVPPSCQANQVLSGNTCVCSSGYAFNNNGSCSACPSGSTASADQSRCVCAANQMFNPNSFTCVTCPPNSGPSSDKSMCICNPGFSVVNNNCVQTSNCQANQVMNGTKCVCIQGCAFNSNGGCSVCPSGSTPSADQSQCLCGPNQIFMMSSFTCSTCPPNSAPNSNQTSCLCMNGYIAMNGACVPSQTCQTNQVMSGGKCMCISGSAYNLNGGCTMCPSGSSPSVDQQQCVCYSVSQIFSQTSFTCVECPINSSPTSDKSNCQCNPGYSYSSITGGCTPVINCQVNQVLNGNTCVCVAGYAFNSIGGCSKCPAGSSASSDQSRCVCTNNQIFNSNSFTCTTCASNSAPNSDQTNCVCISGYTLVNGVCTKIPTCQTNQVLSNNVCVCISGYAFNNYGSCSACPAGSYPSSDQLRCVCPSNQIFNSNYFACSACSPNSTPNSDQTTCVCIPGYTVVNGNCAQIPTCQTNQVLSNNVCVCISGYAFNNYGSCSACPAGSYPSADQLRCVCPSNQIFNSNFFACSACAPNSTPNSDQTTCGCISGYTVVNGNCVQIPTCQANQVLSNNVCVCVAGYAFNTIGGCSKCPAGSSVSSDQSRCICTTNQIFNSNSFTCTACTPNSTPNIDQTNCLCISGYTLINCNCVSIPTCQANQVLSNNQCICISGFAYDKNGLCKQCPSNSKPSSNQTGCICTNTNLTFNNTDFTCSCPTNSALSSDQSTCTCNLGYNNVSGTCTQIVCPVGQTLINGKCACGNGLGPDSTGKCRPCPQGTTSLQNGVRCACLAAVWLFNPVTFLCDHCKPYEFADANQTHCLCIPNYTNISGTCQPGTPPNISYPPISCPADQEQRENTCICATQFIMDEGICKKCPADSVPSYDLRQCDCIANNTAFLFVGFVCKKCPNYSHLVYGLQCYCDNGWTNINNACVAGWSGTTDPINL
jgi:hypothetical protein